MPTARRRLLYFYFAAGSMILLGVYLVKRSERENRRYMNSPLLPLGTPLKSYMFPLRIPEQMTMSTIHFHQFLNLVNDWNFTGVEPFAYSASSTLYGLRSSHANNPKGSIPFNKLYNSTLHNKYLSECMKRQPDPETGVPILFVPMANFLRSSYRKLVLVYFAAHAGPQVLPSRVCKQLDSAVNGQSEPFIDCSSTARTSGMFHHVEQLLSKEEEIERSYPSLDGSSSPLPRRLSRFQGVQAFCIKRGIRISLRDLKTFIFKHTGADKVLNSFSVVFISWQGRFTHPLVDSDVKNYINRCRLPFEMPFYSEYVKNAAKRYIDSLNFHGQPYLSIHVRFEKLYEVIRKQKITADQYVDCCMKRLNSAISAIMKKFNIPKGNALLHWDYSPFGSTACPIRHCREIANNNLKKATVKPTYVEPQRLDLPTNRGLIALVEMNALYNGKALLTVGDGSYQYTITRTFIATHRTVVSNANTTAPINFKPELLQYGHLCVPGKEDIHELSSTLEPKCSVAR